MNNITVGKYVPGNSVMHKLNPLVKLLINITFIVMVFMVDNFIMLGVLLTFMLIGFLSTRLEIKQLWRMFIPVIFIGLFILLMNMVLMDGYGKVTATNISIDGTNYNYGDLIKTPVGQAENGIWYYDNIKGIPYARDGYYWATEDASWWMFRLSDKAVLQTLLIMIRIYIMIIGTTILTATTRPVALTKAIEDMLLPLRLLFVPTHIIAMIISIALRFIPTLLEEAQRIMKAQASRGVDFKNGNSKSKAKSMITLIIPLFVSAFTKAEDLGNAMETRGYNPYEKRTRYRTYPIKWFDMLLIFIVASLLTLVILYMTLNLTYPSWFI